MILANHLILSGYGFWLPNDPRGSWSDFVRSWELFRYGPATKVETRRSVAGSPHDQALRLAAKSALKYEPVIFNGEQARAIAMGFAEAAREANYMIYALAILPDHAHVLVGRHPRPMKQVISHLKSKATMRLTKEGLHPFTAYTTKSGYTPSPWAAKGWTVLIDDPEHFRRAIEYVQNNPMKEGLSPQYWKFLAPSPFPPRDKSRR